MGIFLTIKLFLIFYLFHLSRLVNDLKPLSDSFIYDLRINHQKNPFAIGIEDNNFSFLSKEKGPFKALLYIGDRVVQAKHVELSESHSFTFSKPLKYNKKYRYVVQGSNSRNEIEFETTIKLDSPFIKPKNRKIFSPIFCKNFTLDEQNIFEARLYITGLGLYQAFINNKKVGNAYLTPGFNDYDYYLRYQAYNISDLLKSENSLEVHMGDGWYKGRIGLQRDAKQDDLWGNQYKLCAHIIIKLNNGNEIHYETDETWNVKRSKEIANNIYDGEFVDYTQAEYGYEGVIISKEKYNLIPDFGAMIVQKDILYPELYISPQNEKILDFKQNMVGFVRFKGFLKYGETIHMSHGEILQNNSFFNINLRSAKQELKFIGDGEKRIYEPKFTYFGFRYVLVKGLDNVNPKDFEGIVIYTDLEKTINCTTDNPKINKLMQNAYWGQRGNFLDVPTDCPQRDERLGWTGDTQVFSNTACYNMDSYIFYKKFMSDLRGDQLLYYDGNIPAFSPSLKNQAGPGGAVWSDVGTILPWNIYLNYGDINLLKKYYQMMKDYVNVLIKKDIDQGRYNLILEGFTYGDWLALDTDDQFNNFGATDNGFIMSVYYYHSVDLLTIVAKKLKKIWDYFKYSRIKKKIYDAILKEFFEENGKLKLDTQTSYVLCLFYKIYKNKEIIINSFKERLYLDSYHIKTGFTGTPLILLTLFDNDMDEYAYRILYNEDFPGWLYAINLGATTIWERWNSLLEDGTVGGNTMNSFNHYAYGSVCESIYSRIAGLRNLSPGWKKVKIKPQVNYRIKSMDFSYDSISGKYEIKWNITKYKFNMDIIIPYGCRALVELPDGQSFYVNDGKFNFNCKIDKKILAPDIDKEKPCNI